MQKTRLVERGNTCTKQFSESVNADKQSLKDSIQPETEGVTLTPAEFRKSSDLRWVMVISWVLRQASRFAVKWQAKGRQVCCLYSPPCHRRKEKSWWKQPISTNSFITCKVMLARRSPVCGCLFLPLTPLLQFCWSIF